MIVEVTVGDRGHTVAVVRRGHLLHVTLDGRTHCVDARRIDEATLSLLLLAEGTELPSRSIEAAIAPVGGQNGGDVEVHIGGRTVGVKIGPAAPGRQRRAGHAAGSGPQRVVAPMPGKVVRVLVAPGDAVTARQGLVVVEAMKMENELRAAREGRVREVSVTEGQSVDAGAVLLIVE